MGVMTATERLRALLDERGVEWGKALTDLSRQTHWSTERYWCAFTEWNDAVNIADTLTVYHVSPEQAVEATLGRGTCDMEFTQAAQFGDPNGEDSVFDVGMFRCTACGTETYGMWNDNDECREWPRYCPSCGRRVEP